MGADGPVSEQSALRTLVLAIKGPSPEGKRQFPSGFINKEGHLFSYSVVVHSLGPHGLWPTRLLCPWNSPGKNTAAGCHLLL